MEPRELIAIVREHDDPVVSTREVSEETDLSRRRVLDLLRAAESIGQIESKQIDGRARVWYLPQLVDQEDHPHPGRGSDVIEPDSRSDRDQEESADLLDELVDDLDLPGSREVLEERREAVRACLEYLRDQQSAQKSDFIDEIRPDHPAGYQSANGWWNTIGKKGLAEISERSELIERPPEGDHATPWRFD